MQREPSGELTQNPLVDLKTLLKEAARSSGAVGGIPEATADSYRVALGREIIQLGVVEFRILLLLASRPYHAFTREQIAHEVSTADCPVGTDQVDGFIASLISQLGPFHDYVQAVPYLGYRFKA